MARGTTELTDREQQILAFERTRWRYLGEKEKAIREQFGVSGTRYLQELNALIDKPAALAAHPVLVKRLRRLRRSHRVSRAGRPS